MKEQQLISSNKSPQHMQHVEPDEVIESSKLFHDLQPEEIAAIIAHSQLVSYKRGELILERGIWHGQLYIIVSGQVSILLQEGTTREQTQPARREYHGDQSIFLAQLGPGECFGEMSLITGDPPSATVRAERDTTLWSLTYRNFMTAISTCPTLLKNINAILSQRLARMNQHIPLAPAAEKIWLMSVETPSTPPAHSLAFHIADALAMRSRKRVLLIDMVGRDMAPGLHFVTYSEQLRPSLLECLHEHSTLQHHQAPTVSSDGLYYPAVTTLLPASSSRDDAGSNSKVWLDNESYNFDLRSVLTDLAKFYDYLLLVTTHATPAWVIDAVADSCSRAVMLISSDATTGKESKYNGYKWQSYLHKIHMPGAKGIRPDRREISWGQSDSMQFPSILPETFSTPYSIFVTDVPESPTIGLQDRYAMQLGHSVTRLLPADAPLLQECWKRREALSQVSPQADLTKAVDFVARHIAHQTVGIAFGGGGARGFAHLGAFERLLHYGIPVDYMAGCSIGILPPGLHLIGKSFAESEEMFLDIQHHVMQWGLPRTSIFSNRGLKRHIRNHCHDLRFENLSAPFAVVAVDLTTRAEVVIDRGPLWIAVLAGVAIPGVFPPVTIGNHVLVDAGIHDPVPIRVVRKMGADILLALDLDGHEPLSLKSARPVMEEMKSVSARRSLAPNLVDVLFRSYEIGMSTISMYSDNEADVVIRPKIHGVSLLQFAKGSHLVAEGREAVEQSLPALRKLLPWL